DEASSHSYRVQVDHP
ncbi:tRNA-i(6)A37 thiotransferase enzyme MiaB, partial [Vibrio parahaemolyticus AQ3810]